MGDFDASAAEHGVTIDAVDWLPSGGRSGLVRVRGRHAGGDVPLPELVVEHGGEVHRHASLPDPRAGRETGAWRGAYVVHAGDVQADDAKLRLEFTGGVRIALPKPGTAEPPSAGGEVVDRAVLAERRARRAEAAEQAQARIAREALKAVEVLELRAAQLEERLEAAATERDALAGRTFAAPDPEVPELRARLAQAEQRVRELHEREPETGSVEEAQRRADRLRDALTTAIATVGELRLQLYEARLRSRTAEIENAADAVRVRVLASERGALVREMESLRRSVSEAELLRTIQAAEIEQMSARAAGAEAAHDETRRQLAGQAAELRAARERIGLLEAELAGLRAELPERVNSVREQSEREFLRRQENAERDFAEREARTQAALVAARAELERVEASLARAETARELALSAASAAEMKLRAAEVARAAGAPIERDDSAALEAAALAAELESARAQIEAQSAKLLAADALEIELERARELLATQSDALETARSATAEDDAAIVAGLTAELDASRETVRTLGAELDELRARTTTLAAELESERERRRAAEARPAPPPPPVPAALPPRAAEQEKAAAAEPPADPGRLLADLDAAAAALRARAPEPEPAAEEETAPVDRGPAITSPAEPPRARVATGRDARDYPSLRGALVKLAHDDPQAAARLLVGLLPAQWRVLEEPVDYDVTIAEAGTYAVTVTAGTAHVRPVTGTRPEAEFHLRTDALTLAEMLAGVGPRPRRFGRAKVSGRARRARSLQPLAAAGLSLPDAVRAGARLEPELVLRTLAYAVRPSWTTGHTFTIAHTFTGPDGDETLYLTARDGRGLTVSHDPPGGPPSATVVITRRAFEAMLRGESPPPGERPATRGDHRAAQTLRGWADRARAGG